MAAADAGVSPDTLRYHERVGLLAPPERSANGYRVYDDFTTERVRLMPSEPCPVCGCECGSHPCSCCGYPS